MSFYLSSFDSKKSIVRSVFFVLVGLFFCAFPDLTPQLFVIILGGIVLFVGAISFLSIFTDNGKPSGMNYYNLGMSLIVGLALILAPGFWVNFIMIVLGVAVALCGISQLVSITGIRKYGVKPNATEYITGILLLGLGIFICFRPLASEQMLMVLAGAGCILYGLSNLLALLHVRSKLKKEGKHIVNDTIEDIDYEVTKN